MKTCKDCIHFEACDDWAKNWGLEDLQFPYECDDSEVLCDNYNPTTLPPAYIGMRVWVPRVFKRYNGEIVSDLGQGHVSGLQQKADKSWKIRCTSNGSVSDYTVPDFYRYVHLTAQAAEEYIKKAIQGTK